MRTPTRLATLILGLALLAAPQPAATAPPEAVTILRDAYGVPHIFTTGAHASERASYANGYAQAEDRLFQMDILRRAATGRLSEMLGADYLHMDEIVRRDGLTAAEREKIFRRLPRRNRRAVEAYRDGVNAFIADVTLDPRKLPLEFGGIAPIPWASDDTVAAAILENTVFGASGGQEVVNAALLLDLLDRYPEAEARGIFDDLFWIEDAAAPTTIAAADGTATDRDRMTRFAAPQMAFLRANAASIRRAADVLRSEQGILGGLGAGLGLFAGIHRH